MTNELVRQLLDQGGFYALEKPIGDMKQIVNTKWVVRGAPANIFLIRWS